MSQAISNVREDDLPAAENQLGADFNCVYKLVEDPGLWTVVGTNLNLGVNEPSRDFIVAAAERTGIEPACLAALIDIEAAKTASEQWDPNSRNPHSTACGLTQFVKATWLEMAGRPTTYLSAAVTERNLVGDEAILDLRFDAQCSIITAADYAAFNLSQLTKAGLVAADADADDKARAMYLAHHDGLGGAMAWLRHEVGEEAAKAKLINAAGAAQAEQAKTGHATWAEAYLTWIYSKVRPDKFRG